MVAGVEDVRDVYAHMGTLATHHAHLAHREGEPVALFQTYDPAEDRVALCYEVRPGDVGSTCCSLPPPAPPNRASPSG
jgi:hypothetical protein